MSLPSRGPFKVVRYQGDTYTIRSLITHRDEQIHVKELRQFVHEGNEQTLYSVALRDHQDRYFINAVTDYHGSLDRRRELKFKVHWTGYDAAAESWVPYSELRDTAALHKYLLAQPAKEFQLLIPAKFFKKGVYSPDKD